MTPGMVLAVSRSPEHGFSKEPQGSIRLLEGLGVEGDAHAGKTAQHLYRKRLDPTAPNLAQVHFLHAELFDEMAAQGFDLAPGAMGENVLTTGIDLITLPTGTIFRIGPDAIVEISGIRDPCKKIDALGQGLTKALFDRDDVGQVVRKAGIMGVVVASGVITPGDTIVISLPPEPHRRLVVV
jgi:MOSC domain-containing protein YiiM